MTKMTSPTDIPFNAVAYPSLKTRGQDRSESLAYTHGHAAGYTAGLRQAVEEAAVRRQEMEAEHSAAMRRLEARTDRTIAVLGAAAGALHTAVRPVVTDAQNAIAAAAMELAETIIGVELSDSELSARAALARVLAVPPPAGTVTVRMNPSDLSVLSEADKAASGAVFIADAGLGRGDAMAEYEHGHLDARIGTALSRARAALLAEDA
jgi:flagellar assembly protein FliH